MAKPNLKLVIDNKVVQPTDNVAAMKRLAIQQGKCLSWTHRGSKPNHSTPDDAA